MIILLTLLTSFGAILFFGTLFFESVWMLKNNIVAMRFKVAAILLQCIGWIGKTIIAFSIPKLIFSTFWVLLTIWGIGILIYGYRLQEEN